MIKKIVKKITQICVALAVMISPVISTAGLGHNAKVYARLDNNKDNQVTWTSIGTLNDGTNADLNGEVLQTLFDKIANTTDAEYSDVATAVSNGSGKIAASTLRTNNSSKDINLIFGGLEWTVVYVSQSTEDIDEDGANDIIATLWLSQGINEQFKKPGEDYESDNTNVINMQTYPDANWEEECEDHVGVSTFSSGWCEDNSLEDYPSNMYGTSYIRALMNGGQYQERTGTNSFTQRSAIQGNAFKIFTTAKNNVNGLSQYITTPANVSWQATGQRMSDSTKFNWGYDCPNDNWDTEHLTASNGGSFYQENSGSTKDMDYTEKTNYSVWKDDNLWLPSLYEVGYADSGSTMGLWETSENQRRFGQGYEEDENRDCIVDFAWDWSWLRSGGHGTADSASPMDAAGDYGGYYGVINALGVRPSLHINLKSALVRVQSQSAIADSGIFVDVVLPTVFVILVGSLSAMYIHSTKQQRERKLLFK